MMMMMMNYMNMKFDIKKS